MTCKAALAALALTSLPLAACVAVPDAPNAAGTPSPAGTPVPLGQPVMAGDLAVTPIAVTEDSRCPKDVQCVWAGRLIVKTRIDGDGWRDTTDITLGESYGTHGRVIALISAEPEKSAKREILPSEYRFLYEAW